VEIMALDEYAFANFDKTLVHEITPLEVARRVGREKEAEEKYSRVSTQREKIVEKAATIDETVKELDKLLEKEVREGSRLFEGQPVSRLSEVVCKPTANFYEIAKLTKNKVLCIGTATDGRIVENTLSRYRDVLPSYKITACSHLVDDGKKLTGDVKFCGIDGKADGYKGGYAFLSSILDLRVAEEAAKKGNIVYVVENGPDDILNKRDSILFKKTLTRFGIPFIPFKP
jgi:hypothetical protein